MTEKNDRRPGVADQEQRLHGFRLSQKITILVVLVALIAGSVVAVADYRLAAGELRQAVEEKLLALLEARRAAIIDYLGSIRRDLRMQANNPMVLDAFREYSAGWNELGDRAGQRLREQYIDRNPYHPAGRKQLNDPGDGSLYSRAHGQFHPSLRDFVELHGYRDMLLIDLQGRILYSVMKQDDFAADLDARPENDDGLVRAFQGIIKTSSPLAEQFVDFSHYLPADGRPTSFIATALYDRTGNRLGVLVLEMPVYRINQVMNVSAGMGATGETFIAGQDLLVRSDSRFATKSTILKRRVDSGPVKAALSGESGVMVSGETDESGTVSQKLSAFAPLDFLGARWAIIAQVDLTEIQAPVARMRNYALINGMLFALLVAGMGYGITRLTVVQPMSAITEAVRRLTQGETALSVPSTDRADEIGDIARALVLYEETLRKQEQLAQEQGRISRTEAVRKQLAEAIEALSDGFLLLDPHNRVVLANSKYKEIYRKSAHLLTPGAPMEDFLRHSAEIGEIMGTQGQIDEYVRFQLEKLQPGEATESRLASGRWLITTNYKMLDGGTVSVCSDITDLKRREQALIESEERYRLLVDTLPDGVLLQNSKHLLFLNPAGRRIFGIGEDESVEKYRYQDFVHEDQKQAAKARISAFIKRGKDAPLAERRIRTRDGRDIWIEIAAVPLRRGPEFLALGIFRDLTEARKVQAEMERQREALHQSEKLSALGSLLAGVAHELNNPLSVVVAQSVLLEETNREEKTIKRAKDIRSAAERCARIVKTFLSMARQQTPEQGAVDINELVDNALELMGYSLRTAGIEILKKRGTDLPHVWGDADQLHQVVANLLVNAQHAMMDTPEPRQLTITTGFDVSNDLVTLTVDDTGPGVPNDMRARIFDPFFTTKPVGVGTGIGLSVCHGVIESHGGTISVTDAPSGGARFLIQLPPASAAMTVEAQPEEPVPVNHNGSHILVVDDELDVAESLAEILGLDGHDVDVADSGASALMRLQESDYDLILTDLRMPRMDGPTLYREIARKHPALAARVAVVTGDSLEAAASDFLKEAGLPVLEKPFVPAEVNKIVKDMLEG